MLAALFLAISQSNKRKRNSLFYNFDTYILLYFFISFQEYQFNFVLFGIKMNNFLWKWILTELTYVFFFN